MIMICRRQSPNWIWMLQAGCNYSLAEMCCGSTIVTTPTPHLSGAYCGAYVRCIPLDGYYLQRVRWQNLGTKPLSYIIK
jgi:hypothetical protein